jgi:hypothetical protein
MPALKRVSLQRGDNGPAESGQVVGPARADKCPPSCKRLQELLDHLREGWGRSIAASCVDGIGQIVNGSVLEQLAHGPRL